MDQTWWQVLLGLVNQWFGAKTVWMPTAGAIATIVAGSQIVKKLLRLAPILDKWLNGWATIGLTAITAGLVVLVPALGDGLQVSDIVATLLALLGSVLGYEATIRLFKPKNAIP
jgi:hypothetical protein